MPFMGSFLPSHFLPQGLAALAVNAQRGKLINLVHASRAHAPPPLPFARTALPAPRVRGSRLGRLPSALLPGRNGREKEQPVSPHNRRRVPGTRHFDLPLHMFRLIPLERWIGQPRHAGCQRPPPLRPKLLAVPRPSGGGG